MKRHAARIGGIAALVGALGVLVACVLPFATITGGTDPPVHPSIINPGFGGSRLFVAEPIVVAMFAFVAGILLLSPTRPIVDAIAAGMLVAFGIQTFFLFLGYLGNALYSDSSSQGSIGLGTIVGMIAGLLLLGGGALGLLKRA